MNLQKPRPVLESRLPRLLEPVLARLGDANRQRLVNLLTVFFSYPHANEKDALALRELLLRQLGPSKRYHFVLWGDWELLPGHHWHDVIQQAILTCDLGLLLVSPEFLASEYISRDELPH